MSKNILFDELATEKMMKGMDKATKAVIHTFGPSGRNTGFDQKYDVPLVTNDGFTIARQITLEDRFESLGAELIKESAVKSNEVSGDGTTAAVVLAQIMIKEAYKTVAAGANPVFLKRGMDRAAETVVSTLTENAVKLDNISAIRNIATVAGGNDPEIGNLIGTIYDELGFDPVVTLEDTQMAETKLTLSHGARLDSGYLSRYFLTDTAAGKCVLEDPYIFVCKDEITDIRSIYHLLEDTINNDASLVIIAKDVRDTAITGLALNVEKGNIKAAALKGPGYSDTRDRNLHCVAAVTGATLVNSAITEIRECGLEVCGRAKRVVIEKDATVIEQPYCADSAEVVSLKKQINEMLKAETKTLEKDKLEQSLGILNSAMAVISVGGISELEMFERKYRIEDAVNAAKRAVAEGIVPGGGKALLLCRDNVRKLADSLNGDEKTGAEVILRSLEAPLRTIVENFGKDAGAVLCEVLSHKDQNFGYDARGDRFGDLFEFEIIDPVGVIKSSFVNAVSIAGIFITTAAAVTEVTPSPLQGQN